MHLLAACANLRNRPKMHLLAACSSPWPELADALVGRVLQSGSVLQSPVASRYFNANQRSLSIHGPELGDVLVGTAQTEGSEQDAPRLFVHDDDVIAREGVLWVGWHERNAQLPVLLGGGLDVRARCCMIWVGCGLRIRCGWVSVRCGLRIRCGWVSVRCGLRTRGRCCLLWVRCGLRISRRVTCEPWARSVLAAIVARIFQLRQRLLNIPLQQQNTLAFERLPGVSPAFLPHRPQQLLVFVVRQRPPLAGLLNALPNMTLA